MWVALLACAALAAETRMDEVVTIPDGEVVDGDLYAAGERIVVAGTVRGDLYAVGRLVEVTGEVTGDLVVAGRQVDVTGIVGDDLRAAAETLDMTGRVRDHALTLGRLVVLPRGSHIDGDLIVGAETVLLGGTIGEDVLARVASLELQGSVLGDADVTGLAAAPTARIGGDLRYASPTPVPLPEDVVKGQVLYERVPEPDGAERSLVWARVSRLAVLALVGLLLAAIAPRRLDTVAARLRTHPMMSFAWGLIGVVVLAATAVVVAVAAAVLAVVFGLFTFVGLAALTLTVGLLTEGLLLAGFAWIVGYVAPVVVAYLAGRWLLDRGPGERRPGAGWAVLLGVTLYVLVASIPVLGQVLAAAVAVIGFGALVQPQAWKTSIR